MTRVWLGKASIPPAQLAPIGGGGEADVYDLGDGRVLKLLKTPAHPDVAGVPALEAAAAARLATLADRLAAFPRGLPARVVAPGEPARARRGGAVVGYAMPKVDGVPLGRWGEPHWRRAHAVEPAELAATFRDLHATVAAVHRAGVVIGDFNDGNVLVDGGRAWLIDTDGWQHGGFAQPMYQERFVDPRLCDPAATAPVLVRPHDADGDWFAFAVMLFRALLLVGPYGGVLAPARGVPQAARPLRGVTVFDPDVTYPRAAIPWRTLPDPLVAYFRDVFERGRRGPFPADLLDAIAPRRASVPAPVAIVRGTLRAAPIDPAQVRRDPAPAWLEGGAIWRRTPAGVEPIGQVLAGATRVWVGARLGVGLWRAGGYTNAFVFRPDRHGLRDGIALPRIRGALVDVHGVCGDDRAWLWWREALAGVETLHLAAIAATGAVLGVAAAPLDDATWLAGVPGACAAGAALFVPTDAGIVRVDGVSVARTFPDTAGLVSAADQLALGPGGLDVLTASGALRLTLTERSPR